MKSKLTYRLAATLIMAIGLIFTSCKKEGCTNPDATNYNSKAKKDDGSCVLPATTTPVVPPTSPPATDTTTVTDKANTKGLTEIGSLTIDAAEATIKLYAEGTLYNGYNKLYVVTTDKTSGGLLKDGAVTIQPMMDMGTMKHSAPFVNPVGTTPNSKGLYEASVVFIMPGNATQKWTVKVKYMNQKNQKEGEVEFPIDVKSNPNRVIDNFKAADDTNQTVFVTWKLSATPTVGVNDLSLMVHYRKNMMEFPAMEDLIIEIDPQMPSMGHGSPNNVNPVYSPNGTYLGKVNFTMSGLWKINLKIKRKDGTLMNDKIYFEYTL
ncbi:MAG: FixH family protein [Flavobacteriales bacterium]|nr:FixH family protein [Flavobacteriales bacterium]